MAPEIRPPAHDALPASQRTSVGASRRDSGDTASQSADIHRRGTECSRAVAQLAVDIIAPAHDAASAGQGTGVKACCRDSGDTASQSADINGDSADVCGRAVTQLTPDIPPPAHDTAVAGQRTGMVVSGGDSGDATGQATHIHGRAVECVRAVAQLTRAIPPPAHDTATASQRTGMVVSGGDSGDATGQVTHIHGRAAGYSRAVAQLTRTILAPARDAPATGQRTGVVVS